MGGGWGSKHFQNHTALLQGKLQVLSGAGLNCDIFWHSTAQTSKPYTTQGFGFRVCCKHRRVSPTWGWWWHGCGRWAGLRGWRADSRRSGG